MLPFLPIEESVPQNDFQRRKIQSYSAFLWFSLYGLLEHCNGVCLWGIMATSEWNEVNMQYPGLLQNLTSILWYISEVNLGYQKHSC